MSIAKFCIKHRVATILAVIMILLVIWAVLPFFIVLAIVLSILSWIKKRTN